jgi:hypothetical protein
MARDLVSVVDVWRAAVHCQHKRCDIIGQCAGVHCLYE